MTAKSITKDSIEWKKVLYERQGVADHYVPPSFLQDLKKNGNKSIDLKIAI